MMSDVAIKLENLSKSYKLYKSAGDRLREALNPLGKKYHQEFYAVNNINLEIRKGEILGIVGRNGAGKSTLLKLITGVLQPSSGQIHCRGNISALLELGSGLNPEFTGIENIFFSGTMLGISRKEMEAKVDDIIAFADIGQFIEQPLKSYSSGMKARLGFALAINMNPDILILDEVLAVGDDMFRRKCYARMEDFFNSGCTVLFVSHSSASINEICSRAVMVDRGELILDGPPKFVTMHYQNFIYSEPARARQIRDQILQLNGEIENKKNDAPKQPAKAKKAEKTDTEERAFFIKGLVPRSTIIDKIHDVDITDVHVETPEKERVNALLMDHEYIICYHVDFQLDADNVDCLVLVRSEKGLPISGIRIPKGSGGGSPQVRKGDQYRVRSRFKCTLLPGNYYISVSVTTMNPGNEKIPLCRISDAAIFKVQKSKGLQHFGIVNLEQRGEVLELE